MSEDSTATDTSKGTTVGEEGSQGSVQASEQTEQGLGQTKDGSQGSEQGEGDKGGQNAQETEESFFDPKLVPAELMPAYKQMQAAFTKKTQEISTFKKEFDSLKPKAEAWGKYEKYAPILEEMLSSQGATKETPEMAVLEKQLREQGYSDEAIELIKIGTKFTLDQLNQQKQTEQQKVEEEKQVAFVTSKIEEAGKLDSRLTDTKLTYQVDDKTLTFGQIVENLVIADPNWTKDPVAATQRAIKTVDALIGKAKTEGKEELSASATSRANKFPNVNSSPQSAEGTEQPMTIREAAKKARKDLGM